MKKRGSVLATVLITSTILLILGTAVSAGVINATKLNKKYSENIDLELAAKSGLNIVLDDFLKIATTEEAINNYSVKKSDIDSIYNESTGIEVNVNLQRVNNKITIISEANDRSNTSNVKVETKIININSDSNPGDDNDINKPNGELNSTNFVNIFGDVTIGTTAESLIANLSYGGNKNIINNGTNEPAKLPRDKVHQLEIKQSEIYGVKSDYNLYEYKQLTDRYIKTENENIKVSNFNTDNVTVEFLSSNILFENGWSGSNNTTINKIENSKLFFDKNVYLSNLTIKEMYNSEFIVNGDFEIQNNFNLGYNDTTINNNIIIVNGNLTLNTSSNINLNNSIIIVGKDFNVKNGATINMNNSVIISCGNMNFNTQCTITNKDKSFIVCGGNFNAQNGSTIYNVTNNIISDSQTVLSAIERFLNIN